MFAASEPFRIAIVAGVTVTKWTRAWQERRRDRPLEVAPTEAADQTAVLFGGDADVSFVRLPVQRDGLSVIRLYSELPVVVVSKEHPLAARDTVTVADLVGETPRTEPIADAIDLVAAGVGVLLLPHSIARQNARNDLVALPITDAAETEIAIAWLADATTPDIEEFVGIVRGRTAASSRGAVVVSDKPAAKPQRAPSRNTKRAPSQKMPQPDRGKKSRGR